jgi:hypothetical protein
VAAVDGGVVSDDILAALTAERYDGRWWKTRRDVAADNERRRSADAIGDSWLSDDEVTTARRRRELLAACEPITATDEASA